MFRSERPNQGDIHDGPSVPGKVPGTLRQLTVPGHGDNRATYTPDGKMILFASERTETSQLWAMDPDGAHPRRIHSSTANDAGRVAPSPDGTRLCFSSDRSGQNAVYVLEIASGLVTAISDLAFWSFGPSWSSKDRIAFFSKKGGNIHNIWTVSPDGSEPRQVTDQEGECYQPWWSLAGTTLAFAADGGTGAFEIWLSAADGAGARPITAYKDAQQPFWSPDGKRIAVSARIDEPSHRIYLINADGSNPQAIGQPTGVDNVHPAWSPDGGSIVFTSGSGKAGSLHVFDLAR